MREPVDNGRRSLLGKGGGAMKKTYVKPELKRHGTLATLTKGAFSFGTA
jgi:hypothetical protein